MPTDTEKTPTKRYFTHESNAALNLLYPLLALTLILILCFGLHLSVKKSGLGSDSAAGWIQAIGAIAAIACSFLIANKQSKENIESIIKSQELSAKIKRKGILAVVGSAKLHATNIDAAVPEEIPFNIYNVYDKTIINGVVETLSAAPLYEIDSPEAIGALISLRDQFVFLGRQVEDYLAGPWGNKDMARILEGLREPEYKTQRDNYLISSKAVLAKNVKTRIKYIQERIEIIETNLV